MNSLCSLISGFITYPIAMNSGSVYRPVFAKHICWATVVAMLGFSMRDTCCGKFDESIEYETPRTSLSSLPCLINSKTSCGGRIPFFRIESLDSFGAM